MLQAFQYHLQANFPPLEKERSLIAVSGGVDSVVLAHLCTRAGLKVSLAHCNFHLRGEESDGDEVFVQEFGDALDVEVFIEHFDTEAYAEEKKCSIQVAARELRYTWFRDLAEGLRFKHVLTAHHANDNLETFIINLLRGTGLEGLTGIPSQNELFLRPMLPFSRQEIESYARRHNLKWREDSSNASSKYLRNKIRHDIIPALEQINPQFLDSFKKTQDHLKQSSQLIENYISVIFSRVAKETDFGYTFNIKLLKTLPATKAVLYELFKPFGFTEWEDVSHLLDAQSGKLVLSKTHRLIKDRENLLLTTIPSLESKTYMIPEEEEVVMLPVGTFQMEKVPGVAGVNGSYIFVDKGKLRFPLSVRRWRKGDFFYPFGMEGKKKLSKFFKDNKLSLPEKENSWVLCSGEDIVWVIGRRADSRFSVENTTAYILKITYTS